MAARRITPQEVQQNADEVVAWPAIAIERAGKGSLVEKIVAVLTAKVSSKELRIGTKMP